MPYIEPAAKERLAQVSHHAAHATKAGELNYIITRALIAAHQRRESGHEVYVTVSCIGHDYLRGSLSYQRINDFGGACLYAVAEFRRRTGLDRYDHFVLAAALDLYGELGVPYEREKIAENGDVYPAELVRFT